MRGWQRARRPPARRAATGRSKGRTSERMTISPVTAPAVTGALLALIACKGKDDATTSSPSGSAAPPDAAVVVDWAACGETLKTAMQVPPTRRVQAILDGCKPCGDWKPLTDWDKLQTEGGPSQ